MPPREQSKQLHNGIFLTRLYRAATFLGGVVKTSVSNSCLLQALPELISEGDQMDSFPLDISSLQFIEAALAGNVDAAELREYLAEIKTALLDPLKHKVWPHPCAL